ncbi:DNA methyltransferase [Desulfonema magnum]|uniref:site-specific DNA-methyltransferase (cytosine-N(4)-specific) n=1 Tax=Desulfonema magnum TaxID=45655 RepID=A0A975GRM6_9BACT|nr:DNA methyltransferase [Desulfonema magnum]QTA91211.1 SAM-dependent methyltransferase [Desulfonema magnum]
MYSSAKLNVIQKTRSNPFSWRGQFTPELVEYFLDIHADSDSLIADPFSGSGTVLLESLKRNLDVIGCEVNPAAYAMSKFFKIGAFALPEKRNLCQELACSVPLSDLQDKPLYQKEKSSDYRKAYENFIRFSKKAVDTHSGRNQLVLILNILFKMENCRKLDIGQAWHKAYNEISSFLLSLPESSSSVSALLSDARNLHKHIERKTDLIITSPPYINVFNYHQNHRIIMELLDFDILSVARSEFGSNRKNRGNRFLTVIQYCIDMAQTLFSMRKSVSDDGTAIMIIGRESNVRKTPFYNGRIIKDICNETGLFSVTDMSERFFKNKFGTTIYEDILTLKPGGSDGNTDKSARTVAISHLKEALKRAPDESLSDLEKALSSADNVSSSPKYSYRGKK